MADVLIENYRGFDISFSTHLSKFICAITSDMLKKSESYESIKKYIDEYKKTNQDFNPFYVIRNPTSYYGKERLKIIGIRKDGRFITEDENGKKNQLSDYSLNDYILERPENANALEQLMLLKQREEQQRLANKELKDKLISEMVIISLKDYKKSLQ